MCLLAIVRLFLRQVEELLVLLLELLILVDHGGLHRQEAALELVLEVFELLCDVGLGDVLHLRRRPLEALSGVLSLV